ncbi:MAG: CDP-alcohol phosphatidyltransferase family protein [Defluviitaleaceae bacterium]|nr:CDP-alcohol phosphatidyltransferase family protein [Defluviitaleaceae bacterium]MCL2262248.1 CDP-alcohol phosphatidyltransferase family protein [Defluviitaleaceae bacterium]
MSIIKYVPNTLSITRIILAVGLIFVVPLSLPFFVLYTFGGITDMIDGPIARKFNVATPLGANLDGMADYIFATIAVVRVAPVLELTTLSVGIIIWALSLKAIGLIVGYINLKQLSLVHTFGNKTGAVLLLMFPLFQLVVDANIVVFFLGIYATLFLLEEVAINAVLPEPNRDIGGIRQALRFRREKLTANE